MPQRFSDSNELSARLRNLPYQFLLAVLNGTAILVIVAAVKALVAMSKVTNLANEVTLTMTDAVLSRIDVNPQQVRANLQMRWRLLRYAPPPIIVPPKERTAPYSPYGAFSLPTALPQLVLPL